MSESNLINLWNSIKDFLDYKYRYIKLTAVEKLIIILSAMTFIGIVFILGAFVLFYLSSSLVTLIDSYLGCQWAANLIMAALFVILIFILFALKNKLIINPISRFITKLFINPPKK